MPTQMTNDAIANLCKATDWRSNRGVVFLDPYGLQVTWGTLAAIARTGALDIWVLFPSGMGLNRLLTKSGDWPAPGLDDTDLSESCLPLELHRA
jgi:three-Cys-motif partner protein